MPLPLFKSQSQKYSTSARIGHILSKDNWKGFNQMGHLGNDRIILLIHLKHGLDPGTFYILGTGVGKTFLYYTHRFRNRTPGTK